MSEEFELVTLRNGHRAVRHKALGEVMHPSVGPWAEANTLYVEQVGLANRLAKSLSEPVRIYDLGLGAAANATAAAHCARSNRFARKLDLHSFEVSVEPLELALADPQGFPFLVPFHDAATQLLRHGRYEEDAFSWTLYLGDMQKTLKEAPDTPSLIFHDPFSPEKNPPLWTPKMFDVLRTAGGADGEGTVLVTYSASTRTRVSMLLGGFFVGTGSSIGTKQETTVAATRMDLLARPLAAAWLGRWTRSMARAPWGADALDADSERQIATHAQFANVGSET